jgi:trimethylamine--corrinoid protein Co-methyltransferase
MEYTETPPLQPVVPGYHVHVLDPEQLDLLKSATLQVLEQVGVHCPSKKALEIYADHGASVDLETRTVRLPANVVMEALSRAPRNYAMGARLASHDIWLDGRAMYCATDGCGVETIDFATRQRRSSRKADVASMAVVADYLSSIGFYWPIVSAQDFPSTAPLHELEASFNHTVKHIQTETVMGERMARYAVEMAGVIAGSSARLREQPPLSLLVCTIAPLSQDKDGMESALVFAGAGLPVGLMSMANTGTTAPATIAGTVVMCDAEIVAALALIQMAYPGAPVFHSLMPGIMHPHTGAYLSTAWEGTLMYAVGVELAHHWGVPTLAGVFGTDAPAPGWQSAGDAASSLLLCALCGAETCSGLGLLESCTLLYPEAIILDTDIYHRVRFEAAGLDTSPEQLALEVIQQVGPGGQYLNLRHTRDHLRQRKFSGLAAHSSPAGLSRDPIEAARQQIDWIINNHHPRPLEPAQSAELTRIVATAGKEFGC